MTKEPISYMVEHRAVILEQYGQCGKSPSKTWAALLAALPEIDEVMKFATFKQYVSVISAMQEEFGKTPAVIQELDGGRESLADAEQRIEHLTNELQEALNVQPVIQGELDKMRERLAVAEGQVERLTNELQAARNVQSVIQEGEGVRKLDKIDGWLIQKGNDGYFRLYRKIKGHVQTVFLGKVLDPEKARMKIQAKLKKLEGDS